MVVCGGEGVEVAVCDCGFNGMELGLGRPEGRSLRRAMLLEARTYDNAEGSAEAHLRELRVRLRRAVQEW